MRISPEAFRLTEDHFLDFLRSRGIKCGRRAELERALRQALARTANLDRYTPDLWATLGRLTYIDVKSETAKNAGTGNGTIELRPLLRAQLNPNPPTIFVHYPDWGWADADTLVAAHRWACCDNCFEVFVAGYMPPEKCPKRSVALRGTGDPYILYPLAVLLPIEKLLGVPDDLAPRSTLWEKTKSPTAKQMPLL